MSRPTLLSSDSLNDEFSRPPSWCLKADNATTDGDNNLQKKSFECISIIVEIIDAELFDNHILYVLKVTSLLKVWQVKRRFKDFFFLDQQLRKYFDNSSLPTLPPRRFLKSSTDTELVSGRRDQLQIYINVLVLDKRVWTRNELVLFLDDDSNPMMFLWNLDRMRQMQEMLSTMKIENKEETEKLNSNLNNARNQVLKLKGRLSRMEMIFLQQITGLANEKLPSSVIRSLSNSNNSDPSLSKMLANELKEMKKDRASSTVSLTDDDSADEVTATKTNHVNDNDALLDTAILAHVASGNLMAAEDVVKVLSSISSHEPTDIKATTRSLRSRSADDITTLAVSLKLKEALKLSNELLGEDVKEEIAMQRVSEVEINRISELMKSTSLNAAETELYSFNKNSFAWVNCFVGKVENLVNGLCPSLDAIKSRMEVFKYIRDVVAKSLNVQLFPFGSFTSNTFLPDSNINTTAFVSKNEDDSWFVRLNEAICLSIFKKSSDAIKSNPSFTISNVSFVNGDYIKMIKSSINKIAVDISVNQISALYMEALINKINNFISKEHLFKRSVILIKAWCLYESPKYTNGAGSIMGNNELRLSMNSLMVMIIWVFNSKGKDIEHPIQALGQFLSIFSSFDWSVHALTITGPVNSVDASFVVEASDDELFIPIEVFTDILTRKDENTFLCFSSALTNPVSSGQNSESAEGSVSLSSSLQSGNDIETHAQENTHTILNKWVLKTAFPRGENSIYVQSYINVLDPLDRCCNSSDKIDVVGYEAIMNAFQEGYQQFQNMCESFKTSYNKDNNSDVAKFVKIFFANSITKVPSLDSTLSYKSSSPIVILKSQYNDLEFSLQFAEFILGGKIESSLLIDLVVQIIQQRGQMPVGEVGKNLQLILGSDTLPRRLKDQFGGLKKALETMNDCKLKVGSEHPFNPMVSLGTIDNNKEEEESNESLNFAHIDYVLKPILSFITTNATNSPNPKIKSVKKSFFDRNMQNRSNSFNDDNSSVNSYITQQSNLTDNLNRSRKLESPKNRNHNFYPPPLYIQPPGVYPLLHEGQSHVMPSMSPTHAHGMHQYHQLAQQQQYYQNYVASQMYMNSLSPNRLYSDQSAPMPIPIPHHPMEDPMNMPGNHRSASNNNNSDTR